MPPEIRRDEPADRNDPQSTRANVVEGVLDEPSAEALALEQRRDVGVHEREHARFARVPDLAGQLAVDDQLVAELGRVVAHLDLHASILRMPRTAWLMRCSFSTSAKRT